MADAEITVEVEGTTPETPATETQETSEPAELGDAGKKALKAERDRAAAAEKEAKDLKARLGELERAQMSEQERAVAEAIDKARSETRTEYSGLLVAAEVKAAATGLLDPEQIISLLDTVDLTKFLTDDGQVDTDRIKTFIEGIAPKDNRPVDLGQGPRNSLALGSDPLLQALKNTVGAR